MFVERAADADIIDGMTASRLNPILNDSSVSWGKLRDIAAEFSFASNAVPRTFTAAARDLQDSFANTAQGAGPEDHPEILTHGLVTWRHL